MSAALPANSSFLLTRLMRGATTGKSYYIATLNFNFYSRASCEARLMNQEMCSLGRHFYSRASCEARLKKEIENYCWGNFYSRASCEARQSNRIFRIITKKFLLTRLMRGATMWDYKISISGNFYSRASCEARLSRQNQATATIYFYSRASCEARQRTGYYSKICTYFYSRASCEARPAHARTTHILPLISTHAPHARRDLPSHYLAFE